jgi:hypothetical protein
MRLVNRAENWERAYEAFQQVNFAAWDYNTIKESLLDYLKLYHPEDFKDFIESSEFITLIEVFAYIGEQMAYRLDMNAHENFMSTAERKESVLRLAKLVSYNASRNIPARGIVKIQSISSSERIFDANGINLSNKNIRWNDPINPNWKEQFTLVMNRVLEQDFGSVSPDDRIQIQDVVFELYTLRNNPLDKNVIKYDVNTSGESFPMELVSVELNSTGPAERRPEKNQKLSIMYLNDGLGDTSDNTGFFLFTKQGEIQRVVTNFDGITPNQTYKVNAVNCNETDVWLNNINPDDGTILTDILTQTANRTGAWERVDVANAQNIIFNTNPNRNKYEIETLENDRFSVVFGDGKFSNIPSGSFELWFRTSANKDVTIPTNAIQNVSSSLSYRDVDLKEQSFSFSFSLMDPIQNSAPSEDIDRIRRIAPAVYYTQDRMVNGRDYNEFMLQDNTILKLRAINRTFAGDSKYLAWHDPREYYENVKIFGDDLTIYFKTVLQETRIPSAELPPPDGGVNLELVNAVVNNYISPILDTEQWFVANVLDGVNPTLIRKYLNPAELVKIKNAMYLLVNNNPSTLYLRYDINNDEWVVLSGNAEPVAWNISVTINPDESWDITFKGKRLVAHSDAVKFWINNDNRNVITSDTLKVKRDQIVILKANINANKDGMLARNYPLNIMAQELLTGVDAGNESIHDLHVIPADLDNNGIPDDVSLAYLVAGDSYVYFSREFVNSDWVVVSRTTENTTLYNASTLANDGLWKRERGVYGINFLWLHRTPRYHLIDPSPSNIIDMFVITRGHYALQKLWMSGKIAERPEAPTPFNLRNDYQYILQNKMISDTVVLHPGKLKVIIGKNAPAVLKGTIKVIRSNNKTLTGNQIKTMIVDIVDEYFDINKWEFGETFYFTELASFIHSKLPIDIDSVVFVPSYKNHLFGDLLQVFAKEDEIIQPSISVSDIEIIESLNPRILKQNL